MAKSDVIEREKNNFPVCILRFCGKEMHNGVQNNLWKYLNCDEYTIKDDVLYKVWCDAQSPREAGDSWSYLVFYFEEVPKVIIEIEKYIEEMKKCLDNYWKSKDFLS